MIWYSILELDLCLGLLMIIIYGLTSLRGFKNLNLADVHFACQSWPLLAVMTMLSEAYHNGQDPLDLFVSHSFDIFLALITVVVLGSFKSFESLLLMMMAYVAQAFILHSCDLVSFYVCLEGQNFCFLVLCGLQPDKRSSGFSVEASLKFLLLSAFSSGVLLFCFASLYLQTGMTSLFLKTAQIPYLAFQGFEQQNSFLALGTSFELEAFLILLALLFKLGSAPVHLWVVYIYQSIKRPLLMYISTAPKLSLFTFWSSAWQLVWTDYTLSVFIVYTLILGSLGAYGLASQPAVRALLAYSTISEIGFMLLATETAGFHTLFQHLSIYILTQLLIWNLSDKRLFSISAVSLAGIPPLAGFFGKAWIFFHCVTMHMVTLLLIAVVCSVLAIVYYIRLLRLFWNFPTGQTLGTLMYQTTGYRSVGLTKGSYHSNSSVMNLYSTTFDRKVGLTSACLIALIFLPIFVVKPFVL
jgi:NADH:ubiquinone oxidoreductase subunit 2 (subunit N)